MPPSNLVTGLVGLGLLGGLAWFWQASRAPTPSDPPEGAPDDLATTEPTEASSAPLRAPANGDHPMHSAPLSTAKTTQIATFALG